MHATSLLHSTRPLIPVPRAPARLARRLGFHRQPLLHRYGGRDAAAGIAALAAFLAPAMWARALGPRPDPLMLRRLGRRRRHTARNISIAVGAVAGIALIDLGIAALLARRARR